MKTKILLFLTILFFHCSGFSRNSILDYVISVNIKSTQVKTILMTIEKMGEVQFSYNPNLINEKKIVSLQIREKTIAHGLSLIFDKTVRFKEVGRHIVLLKNEDKKEVKKRLKTNTFYSFSGRITNKYTGRSVRGASVYDIDSRFATLSNGNGAYLIEVQKSETVRSLYISKKGFRNAVIVIDTDEKLNMVNHIKLVPLSAEIEKMASGEVGQIPQSFEDRLLSGVLVSDETFVHSENLPEINDSRLAQISLIPSVGIGSNLSTNGLITNHYSLNIIAGYSKGLEGVEIGGISNIVSGEVYGVQIGGIANFVGGNVTGVQLSGILNRVQKNYKGVQIGGILTEVGGDLFGIQISSIVSKVKGDAMGIQVSGIKNDILKGFTGVQLAGISSSIHGGFVGLQLSGITNYAAKSSYGFQLSGISNVVRGELLGGQVTGICNYAKKGSTYLQLSGIQNYTNKNLGVQLTGIFNYATENEGVQIGLINISKSSKGMALGLINFVKEGYHKTEISYNEVFHANITLKSGVKKFYNIYGFGVRFEGVNMYYGSFGIGSMLDLTEKAHLSFDLTGGMVFRDEVNNDLDLSTLTKLSTTFDYTIAKWLTLFIGPSFNVNVSFDNETVSNGESTEVPFAPIYQEKFSGGQAKFWIGGQVGVRL